MAIKLTLYVMGGTHRAARAIRNLQRRIDACDVAVDLELVDLIEDPARGAADRILATPTLVRREPAPEHRIVGDLSVAPVLDRLLQSPEKLRGEPVE